MNWMGVGRTAACVSIAVMLGACAATVNKGASADKVVVPVAASKRLVLQMTGTPEVLQSKDWEPFKGEWRAAIGGEATGAGMAFEVVETPPAATAQPGTLVKVDVQDYRYLSTGARYGLGILAGNAYIDAKVRFVDAQSGETFGEQRYNTSSSAWEGVFSAMTDKQVQAIAREVVQEIRPR